MRPARLECRRRRGLLTPAWEPCHHARGGGAGGGTLVVGLDQEPPTLDPHASPSAVTYQIIASVTENLVYRGPDGKLVPWLAESWSPARDSKSVTFKLRRDVKFHDGTPFNAEAVKFNFDRIVDPKFKAGGARAALAGYAGSKVLDEYTVQVSFETPYAPFLNFAASGVLSLVSPKAVRESGDAVHTRPVGSGPFMIKEYVAKDHATMVRNPAYARKAPWSDRQRPSISRRRRVEVRAGAGHAGDDARERRDAGDLLRARPGAAPDREEPGHARREDAVAGARRASGCSTSRSRRWTTTRVRRAINYAVDKEAFVADGLTGASASRPSRR